MKHENGKPCERCFEFLKDAHPTIRMWFYKAREQFPTMHTCRVWSGKDEQDKMVAEKKSQLKWPHSKHNYMENGVKLAKAMDLFSLAEDGKADWRIGFTMQICNWFEDQGAPIQWGGKLWKGFTDGPHFELKD